MLQLNWDNITIMVVDDNSFMRNLIVTTLRALGIGNIATQSSARSAIETLQVSRKNPIKAGIGSIDIVLSDFVMSEVDGALFLRWVRTSRQAPDRFVPFVMVSGAADKAVVEKARDAGVTDFLAKPFSARSMADRLLEVIKNPRQFVLAPNYFGPDRRRQDRMVDWRTLYDDDTRLQADRRITQASDIQVIHAQSNIRSLRDDVRAIYFRPANKLRDKLGPNALRGQIDFDPLVIQAAEERIQELVGDYSTWVRNYLDSMTDSHNALRQGAKETKHHVLNINQIAHELRGQGGIFDYPLITAFGKSLYEATIDTNAKITENRLMLVEAHIDAIRLVFTEKVRGKGGEVGGALLKDIEKAVKKYSEPPKVSAAS
ncbi:response regulator [Pelagibius litoralis]|uniref:Response regulator n=1 Tax=Pelagibius litoralis TaxID=374515 RepID=A0A967KF08_9PROT|nr:response regulator [Pelagibius litoralis]NIA71025.1 response regulator [Pelagibius litoralis]